MYYIKLAASMRFSRDILLHSIKSDTYKTTKILPKTHNFDNTLPTDIKQQADIILKDTYNFSFIGMPIPLEELDLGKRLVEKIKNFLMELGEGFSFMGNQYRLHSKETDCFVDLLFFNRNLKCLIAIELKIGQFKPEYVGKMNFYLGLLDDQVKKADENPSIGIILCADKRQCEC